MTEIIEHACMEGEIYKKAKVDAILIENMHDRPYVTPPDVGPEVVAAMASICTEVRKVIGSLPCGVQILAAANQEALAVAHATGRYATLELLKFMR